MYSLRKYKNIVILNIIISKRNINLKQSIFYLIFGNHRYLNLFLIMN